MSGPAGTGGGVDDRGVLGGPTRAGSRDAGGGGTPVRGRSVGRSTAYRWTGTAREEGRRTAKRMGGGAGAAARRRGGGGGAGRAGVDRSSDPGGVPRPPGRADRRAGVPPLGRGPWAGRRGGPDVKRGEACLRAAGRDREGAAAPARAGWSADAGGGRRGRDRPERPVFLEECGVTTAMAPPPRAQPRAGSGRARGTVRAVRALDPLTLGSGAPKGRARHRRHRGRDGR